MKVKKRKEAPELAIFEKLENLKEKTYLKLVEEGREIKVIAVDRDGFAVWAPYLIGFNRDGTITRYTSVNPNLGFKLDDSGRIKLGRED